MLSKERKIRFESYLFRTDCQMPSRAPCLGVHPNSVQNLIRWSCLCSAAARRATETG